MSRVQEIATIAGVSTATVSHVINGSRYVSPEIKERVLRAIQEKGVKAEELVRGPRDKKTRTLLLLISDLTSQHFGQIARGICAEVEQEGYFVSICNTNEDPEVEARYLKMLESRRIDGLIVSPANRESPRLARLQKRIPTVYIDRRPVDEAAAYVVVDNYTGAQQLTEHLINTHHPRRLAAIVGRDGFTTSRERLEGFMAAVAAATPPVDYVVRHADARAPGTAYAQGVSADARAQTKDLLTGPQHERPDALFLGNHRMLWGAIEAILDLKRAIPNEVACVGFDETEWMALSRREEIARVLPPITHVRQPVQDLGRHAGRLLLRLLDRETLSEADRHITLPVELVLGESSGYSSPHPGRVPEHATAGRGGEQKGPQDRGPSTPG